MSDEALMRAVRDGDLGKPGMLFSGTTWRCSAVELTDDGIDRYRRPSDASGSRH